MQGYGCPRKIEVIERGAFSMNKLLKTLDLRGNKIVAVPDVLPTGIVNFLLGHNEIKNLQVQCTLNKGDFYGDKSSAPEIDFAQGKFATLTSLETLDLSFNKLRTLCVNDFVGQYSLKKINLTNNFLDTIPETTFSFAEKLEVLDLSFNQLKTFDFQGMSTVKELYMRKNSLYKVNDPTLLSSVTKLDLAFNNWNCDCNLKGLVAFMREPPETVEVVGLEESSMYFNKKLYACNMPLLWSGKSLNLIQIPELVCEREKIDEDNLPFMSIAAPISIVVILLVVILVVYCASKNRRTRSKQRQFGRMGHTNKHEEKVVASGGAAAKNIIKNDAAILCHVNSQKWVIDIMLPTLKQKPQQTKLRCEKLYIDVFTIKSQVKNEKLRRCVEQNRRVVIIITEEFARSDACIFCLEAIFTQTRRHRKDGVVLVVLDPIPWDSMPQPLKVLMAEKTFIQYPVEDVGRQTFYFWDALRASIYADQLEKVDEKPAMNKTTQLEGVNGTVMLGNDEKSVKEFDQGDHVDDIYDGIDLMKKQIIEKRDQNQIVTNNLTKVETINPRDIKKIGVDTHRLPHEIEIENPYRDAVLLNEMAKATSKEEVLEIHEDLEDLYQKRHTWQARPQVPAPDNIWTGNKFALPQGEDAQSVYSKDNNGIPKNGTLTRNPGQIQTANFVQPNAGNQFHSMTNHQPHIYAAQPPARPPAKAVHSPHYESADIEPEKLNWATGHNKIQQ